MEILKWLCPASSFVADAFANKAKENPEKARKSALISIFNPALGI